MSTTATTNPTGQTEVASRVLREGYGPGAWHGPDLKAAISDVDAALAFWRPAKGRHNIAEIALHHAFFVRSVREQLSGQPAQPFVLPGEEWFELGDEKALSWRAVQSTVESEQARLSDVLSDIQAGKTAAAVADAERFNLVLGITCHAVYHAGQIQLIKRLRAG